jgi:transcriptional regulator with XRE-family HTH domain
VTNDRSLRSIGERLTLARKTIGRTQADFARQARVSNSAYNQYERGRKRPAVDQANRLCDAYQLTLDWIYRGDLRGLPEALHGRIIELQASEPE